VEGKFVANPTKTQLSNSDLNIIVAGTRNAVVMVEGWAAALSEQEVLDAIFFGHESLIPLLDLQDELVEKAGKPKMTIPEPDSDLDLQTRLGSPHGRRC